MNSYRMVKDWYNPEYGDFNFLPLSGVVCYWNGTYWRDNLIVEENGDEFEIVRLDIVSPPEDFTLTSVNFPFT